jgi:hypothetical protein
MDVVRSTGPDLPIQIVATLSNTQASKISILFLTNTALVGIPLSFIIISLFQNSECEILLRS